MTILCVFHFRASINTAERLGRKLRVLRSEFWTRKSHPSLKPSCCIQNWSCAHRHDGGPGEKDCEGSEAEYLRTNRNKAAIAVPGWHTDCCPDLGVARSRRLTRRADKPEFRSLQSRSIAQLSGAVACVDFRRISGIFWSLRYS